MHHLLRSQLLYIPMGWITVEQTSNPGATYGLRKCCFTKCEASIMGMTTLMELNTGDNTRYEAIRELLK